MASVHAAFMFETLTNLHAALDRVYKLAVSLTICEARSSAGSLIPVRGSGRPNSPSGRREAHTVDQAD